MVEVPGAYYGMSGKGWTDQEMFSHWLKKHFLKCAVPGRPLHLLLDGHSSHLEPASIELAWEEGIILSCLPPHTKQDSQPLIVGPLKWQWSNACHEFQQYKPGVVVTKFTFSKVFAQACLKALTPENTVGGFKKCGIHPFNRNAISLSRNDESQNQPSTPEALCDGESASASDTPTPCLCT